MDTAEYQESTSITFEWVVKDVKSLFESSKGDAKSKVIKSMKFGGGRWQILFYANAGTEGGYVSLYLSCEPTVEEKDGGLDGKWTREGIYQFSFELQNVGKTFSYNKKEAHSHSFSHKTANWGWAQFARRDAIYYNSNTVKQQDAFLIACTINSAPTTPHPVPTIPRLQAPKDLLDMVGSLLDDPLYSDVEFILPRRGGGIRNARRIWAARKLLKRVEYFDTMFNSGFAEGAFTPLTLDVGGQSQLDTSEGASEANSFTTSLTHHFEDSDDEEDEIATEEDDDIPFETDSNQISTSSEVSAHSVMDTSEAASFVSSTVPTEITMEEPAGSNDGDSTPEPRRNVRAKLSHPSSPQTSAFSIHQEWQHVPLGAQPSTERIPGAKKQCVLVHDVAYPTYRAVLYYIYTNTIVFAPLSSSFISTTRKGASPTASVTMLSQNPSESQMSTGLNGKSTQQSEKLSASSTSRREWIKEWQQNHPGRPAPCSAKAAYRLADKLDLRELKERASQHIIKSLTVDNISYEVFSPFSAAFEEVRKIQVNFFLDHWIEIRASDAMRNVWQQIRVGRHPGFEEVWPVIAQHLEFKPRPAEAEERKGILGGDF